MLNTEEKCVYFSSKKLLRWSKFHTKAIARARHDIKIYEN